ncbi:serine/threonine-protein kinase [Kocuria rhizophila]|nr:protein kinase [Bacillus sp. BGMRC0062]
MRDTIAGRFELLTPIAEGGSGAVWRAHDLRLGTECAAKVLRQRDSADLLRFVREQSVNLDHPHVVAPYGWAAEDEHVAIAMELVSGGTLEAALQDNGAVADWLAEEFVCQLLEALRFVHTRGWVHRDVKPANVLLEPTGSRLPVARLADFGIAVRLDDARLTHTGTVVGTPGYLPSEAYAPGNPSRSMDLYAAGVTAVRMVLPEVDLSADPLRPEDVAELALFEDSPALRTGVAGLLDPDPEERVRAADRLLAQLLDTASARADRAAETAEGEPFEVFDVLEPTTERELSPVADAARLPPGARRTADAPIAWHAVHRQAISAPDRPAMTERGGDLLRPFSPVGGEEPDEDRTTPVPTTRWPVAGPPVEDSTELIDTADTPVLEQVSGTGGRATAAPGPTAPAPTAPGPEETARLAVTSGDAVPAGAADGMTSQDPVGARAAAPSRARGTGRSARAPRWPWWVLAVTLAVLALVAGYVWLGPALARWGGAEGPGTTPEPTRAPETSGVPSDGGGGPPAATTDVTPECTQLEDGTVSCVVTP